MTERALVTKLILKALGQNESIESLDDRKRIQKIIYLAQQLGLPLGYGFGWYLRGPYSSSLAKDYYNMPDQNLDLPDSPKLRPEYALRVAAIKDVLESNSRPNGLSDADWLEAVASVHYLDRVSKLDEALANDKMLREKPRLAPYIASARNVIQEHIAGANA